MTWIVHKFGGSSLESAEKLAHVGQILGSIDKTSSIAVVLSAMGGITDRLVELYHLAVSGDQYDLQLESILTHHTETITHLLSSQIHHDELHHMIEQDGEDIKQILRALSISRAENLPLLDLISGYGELWVTKIMDFYLQEQGISSVWRDSRDIITLSESGESYIIDWKTSAVNLKQVDIDHPLVILPGFVARFDTRSITTLGRNGSDLSASIFSVLLNASELNIWTDVNGIYSADPRRVEDANILPQVSYLEVLEMAYFGAEVLHPRSIQPVVDKKIPIIVRNTFNPDFPGTRVSVPEEAIDQKFVKAFASIDSIALVTIEGAGMIGVPGISETLFRALRQQKISVIMISQSSSEFSISVAVRDNQGILAKQAIEHAFEMELYHSMIRGVTLERGCAILSVVGENMVNQPGIASMLFGALSRSRINVRMISQGSSERNISVILKQQDITRGLNAAHSAFFLSHLTISVGIIGTGLIGSSLIGQLMQEQKNLKDHHNIDLKINGIMNSTKMYLQRDIDLTRWEELLVSGKTSDMKLFADYIQRDSIPHTVIIDCSASQTVASEYFSWLIRGIHVITPNKRANSGDLAYYKQLRKYIEKGPATNPLEKNTYYFYETTVGAGLPVIQTLKDLVHTGDTIKKIQGVFSGTLSYIFNSMNADTPLSTIVAEAKEKGYTEPDPRDDLSGMDVARKLVILARESGKEIELEDIEIESLIPEPLKNIESTEEFMTKLSDYDHEMKTRMDAAIKNDKVLRYVGSVDDTGCRVGVQEFDKSHPFAHLRGSENIISFTTTRYATYPLIVQGPGAGAEVTSAGVFSDLLRLAERLGSA